MADNLPIDPITLIRAFFPALGTYPAKAAPSADLESPTVRIMAQALAAANMPSREGVGEIKRRLDRIEEALGRIERALAEPRPRKKRKS